MGTTYPTNYLAIVKIVVKTIHHTNSFISSMASFKANLRKILHAFKEGKTPGNDNIPAEFWKWLSPLTKKIREKQ